MYRKYGPLVFMDETREITRHFSSLICFIKKEYEKSSNLYTYGARNINMLSFIEDLEEKEAIFVVDYLFSHEIDIFKRLRGIECNFDIREIKIYIKMLEYYIAKIKNNDDYKEDLDRWINKFNELEKVYNDQRVRCINLY